MLRSTIAAAAIAAAVFGGCADDDDKEPAPRAAGSVEGYCDLTRQLDRAGTRFFAKLERDENATPADYEAAERRFVEAYAEKLDEVQRAAPGEIRPDVRALLDGMRARAGLEPKGSVDASRVAAAEKRVQAFEERSCRA